VALNRRNAFFDASETSIIKSLGISVDAEMQQTKANGEDAVKKNYLTLLKAINDALIKV
jgi:hypothetical protein